MSNQWFRLYSKIMTDPKIETLAFEDQRHFVWVLCMKNEGYLDEKYPSVDARERMISRKLGLQGEAFENTKKRLLEVGLIDRFWHPVKWDDLQYVSDSSRERTRKYREKLKIPGVSDNKERHSDVTNTVTVTLQEQNRTETEQKQNRTDEGNEHPSTDVLVNATVEKKIVKSNVPACPQEEILALYHEILPEMMRHRTWGKPRQKLLAAIWKENPNMQDIEKWKGFFRYLRTQDFLMGRVPPKPGMKQFLCSLEWLLNPTNFAKTFDGLYE